MGINIVKTDRFDTGFVYDRRQVFLLDTVDDFIMLPTDCAPGSEAYTVDMAVQWRVNSYGNWIEMKSDIPTVPTTVSSFENDAGYLTASDAAPHQQLVTDADGNTIWVDREFYRSFGEVIVPNATYGIHSSYGQNVAGNFVVPTIGKTYHVVFGDIETDKVAVAGNKGVRIGEDYSEFVIEIVSETEMYVETSNTGPKIIEITAQTVKKIDEIFLPDLPIATAEQYGTIKTSDMVGQKSTDSGAEIFNSYTNNIATGMYSHAEGYGTKATSDYTHAEGFLSEATGKWSHAEGYNTVASGTSAHAEGTVTLAKGASSHAEGFGTDANGGYSHAEGDHTVAASDYQHVQGKYNIEDSSDKYAHIVGNGTSDTVRSNAHTLDWAGLGWFAGGLKVGGSGQDDEAAVEVALKTDILNTVIAPATASVGQTITVKSVDESGNPTEWETADMQSGSGLPEGATAHQQLVTDADGNAKWEERPYYKESSFYSPNELYGMELFPCNITVEATEQGNIAEFPFAAPLFDDFEEVRVIFDGEEYSCVVKATSYGTKYIGGNMETMNFDEYPFIIASNDTIATKTAGEHTIDASVKSSTIVANYMPKLTIETSETGDGVPYITENDLQRIATAYQNNIPIYINTGYDGLGMIMHVTELSSSFIYASCSLEYNFGCVAVYTHTYSRSDGNLHRKGKMIQGTVLENGNNAPVMYINNRYYRIGISDSGTLTATEVT